MYACMPYYYLRSSAHDWRWSIPLKTEWTEEGGGWRKKSNFCSVVQLVYTNVIMQCLHLLGTILMHCEWKKASITYYKGTPEHIHSLSFCVCFLIGSFEPCSIHQHHHHFIVIIATLKLQCSASVLMLYELVILRGETIWHWRLRPCAQYACVCVCYTHIKCVQNKCITNKYSSFEWYATLNKWSNEWMNGWVEFQLHKRLKISSEIFMLFFIYWHFV